MNLSHLLTSRPALLRQAALANAGFAYTVLRDLGRRIDRARLHGTVRLLAADPSQERYAPGMIALGMSQALVDEHFDEKDLMRLSDALGFVSRDASTEFEFRLEEMFALYAPPLRAVLQSEGVKIGDELGAPDHRV